MRIIKDIGDDRLRVTVSEGKYTIVMPENGGLFALRHGEPWRDCTGDKLILALAQEVDSLREKLLSKPPLKESEHANP